MAGRDCVELRSETCPFQYDKTERKMRSQRDTPSLSPLMLDFLPVFLVFSLKLSTGEKI